MNDRHMCSPNVLLGGWPRSPESSYKGVPSRNSHCQFYHMHHFIQLTVLLCYVLQPGTIVVNAGDLLARWSNDVLRSTLHRVVAPPAERLSDTEGITPARQSIAFFCNPNGGAEIDCLPTCFGVGKEKKYPPVTTEDYIVGRLSATYT